MFRVPSVVFAWILVLQLSSLALCAQLPSPVPIKTYVPVDVLGEILSSGTVMCGLNAVPLIGYSNISVAGQETGLEVSLCRAFAAGLGATPVFVPVYSFPARFDYLYNRSADVVLAEFTDTTTRELTQNATFGFPYLHVGSGIIVLNSLLSTPTSAAASTAGTPLSVVQDSKMCVTALSSLIAPLNGLLAQNGINVTLITAVNVAQATDMLVSGQCNAFAYDELSLITVKMNLQQAGVAATIISNSQVPFSILPFAPGTLLGDLNWSFYVREITQALFAAEANNITQAVASSAVAGKISVSGLSAEGQRLLGLDATQDPTLIALGQAVARAIAMVGNYGEIYASTFGPYQPQGKADTPVSLGGCLSYPPFD